MGGSADAGANQGGADGEGDVIANCLKAPVMPDSNTQALRYTGAGIELGIVRSAPLDSGPSKAVPYELQRFALVRDDVGQCVSDAKALDYTPSHHNWDDEALARVGDETWVLKIGVPAPNSVEGRTGEMVTWGPFDLTLTSCERLDSPPGPCE
jgi:hypothetical protein